MSKRMPKLVCGMLIISVLAGLAACAPPPTTRPKATSLTVTGFTSGEVGTQQITVTAKTKGGNVAKGYRGTVRLDSFCSPADPCVPADPVPLVPPTYKFTAADAGVHTFSVTIRLAKPGGQSYYVQATDTAKPSLTGQQIRFIRPGTAATINMTAYDPNPHLVIGQVLPKSQISVEAFDQYGNYASDPSLDFDFSTIGFPDNYNDLVDYPNPVSLTNGQATMVVPTPGMVSAPGTVVTSFYLKKPGTSGAGLIYGQVDVTVVSTAPNLNVTTLGGYTVLDSGELHLANNIILEPASYTVTGVDLGTQTITAVNGSTTLTMGVVTPMIPVSGDLYISNIYPQVGGVVTVTGSTNSSFNPVLVTPGQGSLSYSNGPLTYFGPLVNVTGDLN